MNCILRLRLSKARELCFIFWEGIAVATAFSAYKIRCPLRQEAFVHDLDIDIKRLDSSNTGVFV